MRWASRRFLTGNAAHTTQPIRLPSGWSARNRNDDSPLRHSSSFVCPVRARNVRMLPSGFRNLDRNPRVRSFHRFLFLLSRPGDKRHTSAIRQMHVSMRVSMHVSRCTSLVHRMSVSFRTSGHPWLRPWSYLSALPARKRPRRSPEKVGRDRSETRLLVRRPTYLRASENASVSPEFKSSLFWAKVRDASCFLRANLLFAGCFPRQIGKFHAGSTSYPSRRSPPFAFPLVRISPLALGEKSRDSSLRSWPRRSRSPPL